MLNEKLAAHFALSATFLALIQFVSNLLHCLNVCVLLYCYHGKMANYTKESGLESLIYLLADKVKRGQISLMMLGCFPCYQ